MDRGTIPVRDFVASVKNVSSWLLEHQPLASSSIEPLEYKDFPTSVYEASLSDSLAHHMSVLTVFLFGFQEPAVRGFCVLYSIVVAREFHIMNDETAKVFQALSEYQGRSVGVGAPSCFASLSWPQPQPTRP
jgi:hypothetical protein